MKLYSVYDKRAQHFGPLMELQTDAHAVRGFTQEVNRKDTGNMLQQFPTDFALWSMGEFDNESGTIKTDQKKLLEAEAALRPEPENTRA